MAAPAPSTSVADLTGAWCLIDSDPGAFTDLVREIGINGVKVEEVYSLDSPEELERIKPVYGLIFLFKWRGDEEAADEVDPADSPNVYYANQVIENACATQAILSIVLNRPEVDIGPDLQHYKEFTQDFSAPLKGLVLSNSDRLRKAHNSFAKLNAEAYALDSLVANSRAFAASQTGGKGEADVYHFISYVPVDGHLYELDGLSRGPRRLAPCTTENWLEVATPAIMQRIRRYSSNEIRFNLMAVVKDRRCVYEEEAAALAQREDVLRRWLARQAEPRGDAMAVDEPGADLPASRDDGERQLERVTAAQREVRAKLAEELRAVEASKIDSVRRKHNYFPFIMEFLQILADKGDLVPLIEKAKQRS